MARPPRLRGSTGRLVRGGWPWLVAAAVLALLAWRVSLPELRGSLAGGPWVSLFGYTAVVTSITLVLDGWATRRALAVCGLTRPLAEVTAARGSTYLLGLLNYAVGQGGLGFYVYRLGVARSRAVGVVAFLMLVNLWSLAMVTSLGLALTPLPLGVEPTWLPALAAAAGGGLYLALVSTRSTPSRWTALLAPAFEAGARGHLAAAAPRLVHVLGLVAAIWGGLRLWGITVPADVGLAGVPLVLLAAALPVTPGGLGLTQASMVVLFSRYADGATAEREAAVLAFGLAWSSFGYLCQAALGAGCLRALRRRLPPREIAEP